MVGIWGVGSHSWATRDWKERTHQIRTPCSQGIPGKIEAREIRGRKENGGRLQKEVNGEICWRWKTWADECIEKKNEGVRT